MAIAVRYEYRPLGFAVVTGLSAAKGLTPPAGATRVVVQAADQPVRWRDDGVNPTATVGMLLAVDEELDYDGKVENLKFIEAAASAKLNVSFYE